MAAKKSPGASIVWRLRKKGLRVFLDGDKVNAEPKTFLTKDERSQLSSHKAEIRYFLREENTAIGKALRELEVELRNPRSLDNSASRRPAQEGPVCWLDYVSILREGHFPKDVWDETTELLDLQFETHRSRASSKPPRDSELVDELQRVLASGKHLLKELKDLSQRGRLSILDAKAYSPPDVIADPGDLANSIHDLVMRAIIASVRAPRDSRGREQDTVGTDLLLNLAIIWRMQHPQGKGITKVKDDYRGPLLEFVYSILQIKSLPKRSKEAVGADLYKIRNLIDRYARRSVRVTVAETSSTRRKSP